MEQDISVGPVSFVSPDIAEINCSGAGSVTVTLDSADTPTGFEYIIEGTGDGSTWFAIAAVDPTQVGSSFRASQTAVTGQWLVPAGGLQKVRFNLTAITGGTAIVSLNAGLGIGATYLAGGIVRLVTSFVSLAPATAGGMSIKSVIVPNNTTAIVIKGSPGQLYGIRWSNNANTWAYVKLYNDTTATAGAGTPIDRVALEPGHGYSSFDNGIAYGTGIVAIVTTGIADNDTTAPAANEYLISFDYK